MTTTQTNINSTVNSARDNVKAQINWSNDNIKSHVTSLMASPKVVKSVQRGYVSSEWCDFTDNMYSKDYSISAVNPSKTMINLYSQGDYCPISARLMNGNVLRIYSNTRSNEIYKVSWEVIEFY